jgi:predicted component of type VI protein secretion system
MYIHKPIMMKNIHCFTLLLFAAVLVMGCSHKPKPISNNITKTTVTVDGKKDSVINNPKKNYGTATISDPCTRLLLQNIQASNHFKSLTAGKSATSISYTINWVKAAEPKMRSNGGKITNGIEVAVIEKKDKTKSKIGSYIYNNEDAKLYDVNKDGQYDELDNVDSAELKRIRNGCYWGVASHN